MIELMASDAEYMISEKGFRIANEPVIMYHAVWFLEIVGIEIVTVPISFRGESRAYRKYEALAPDYGPQTYKPGQISGRGPNSSSDLFPNWHLTLSIVPMRESYWQLMGQGI
jgi:hypothetical protein